MARVKMAEKKEKTIHTRKKEREKRRMLLELGKAECCCDLKCKAHQKSAKKLAQFRDLPEEIILTIASFFTLKDLLAFSQVSKYLQYILDNAPAIWTNVSFQNIWPNKKNVKYLEKAAEYGNIECLAKLSFVSLYIYNFKPATKKCMKTSLENADKAIKYFSKIDELIQPHVPLTWMFIRPPWAYPGGERKCLKECLLLKLEENCQSDDATLPSMYNVGKTYLLKEDNKDDKSTDYFQKAARRGCANSKFELHRERQSNYRGDNFDAGVMLECIRNLQDTAAQGHIQAQVELCHRYAEDQFGNSTKEFAADFVKKVANACSPSCIHKIASTKGSKINDNMRCILINWMHEVCDVKNIKSEALHMAIDCLDRYLLKRPVHRRQLQLAGVSCVVLASKAFSFNSSNLLTIRESAWLTDSTYEYNEVVKMLAEIIGALNGQLVRMNISHYAEIFCAFAKLDQYNSYFTHYIVDSCLQFCDFGRYKPSLIAASATLLTNIISKCAVIWPQKMIEFTGFEVKDLANCASLLHSKCLLDNTIVTDGEHRICGARDRYSSPEFMEVSKKSIPDLMTIRASIEDIEPRLRCTQVDGMLYFHFKEERNILDPCNNISVNSSFLFGYDGDEEDNLDQNHTQEDLSVLSVKQEVSEFSQEELSEDNHKQNKHYILDYDSGSDETRPGIENCVCKPKQFDLDAKINIEKSMEKLSEAFSAACSCSSSNKSESPERISPDGEIDENKCARQEHHGMLRERVDVVRKGVNTKGYQLTKRETTRSQSTMRLRSSSYSAQNAAKGRANTGSILSADTNTGSENSDRDRRKRRANWPVTGGVQTTGRISVGRHLRPRLERKSYKKEPWRY